MIDINLVHPPPAPLRSKTKDDEKRYNEERIRTESDLKRIYIYATRSIQTQDQTNLNRYALVKGIEKSQSLIFSFFLSNPYIYSSWSRIICPTFNIIYRVSL